MANDRTLEDYYAHWQSLIERSRAMLLLGSAVAYRDAIADEEYARAVYFRLLAEQEGEA